MKMKKTLTLILALVLIASLTIGGTLAYFTWQSEEHENVFQVSGEGVDPVDPDPTTPGIEVEPSWDPEEEHPLTPGAAYAKDPQVSLSADSIDAWVIFKVVEVNNYLEDGTQAVQWAATEGMTLISSETDADGNKVWYYGTKTAATAGDKVCLFTDIGNKNEDGSVLVNPELDEDDIAYLLGGLADSEVKLVITAYAIDASAGTTAAEAFQNAIDAGNVTK